MIKKTQKQKEFKDKKLSENNKKEDYEVAKYKRVKSHYREVCYTGKPCKRVYVRAHLRRIKKIKRK
ncbi:hypothetical protein ES703_102530 [subsurface metagenome]